MSQTPSVQSSQHNPALSSSYVAAPPQYDGRADSFWDWACALALYIKANSAKFPDDKSQIFCALSYLHGSPPNHRILYGENSSILHSKYRCSEMGRLLQRRPKTVPT